MTRLVRPARTSIRLAYQDMWHFYGQRVLIGLSVAILAVVLALIVTGQATLWTLWAYAIFFGGTYLICLGLRLIGWHRLWEPSCGQQTPPFGELLLRLDFKGPAGMRLASVPSEFSCEIRDPSGSWYKTRPGLVGGGGVAVWCNYPSDFDGAPSVVPGIYAVAWRERRPPQVPGRQASGTGGKWRLMDADRFKV
jgi:hypothetical protein